MEGQKVVKSTQKAVRPPNLPPRGKSDETGGKKAVK
jgi:hypothetical protein